MKYIISREELIAWFVEGNNSIDDFFADKKPVEMIASGEVTFNSADEEMNIGGSSTFLLFSELEGTSIKIYIESE